MRMWESEPRQDEVLRMLDTRIACLLVDRPGTEALRRHLFVLREKLARECVDTATLAQVEATVRALRPQTAAGAGRRLPADPRPVADMQGRAASAGLQSFLGATCACALTVLTLAAVG